MEITPSSVSVAAQALRNIMSTLHIFTPDVEASDIKYLESIAATASALAQELRMDHDRLVAQCDEVESLAADRLMCESDAADHSLN